jgi:TonB family protein
MRTLESSLLTYALNSLWQVPLVFATAWLAARVSRRAGPAFQHRLWVSALFVEVLLPACSFQPAEAISALQHWFLPFLHTHPHPTAEVTVIMGEVHVEGGLQLAPALLSAIALLYIGTLIFFAAKLCTCIYRTLSLRRRTEPLTLSGDASHSYHRYARLFAVSNAVLATSAEIAGPMTLGIRRPMLLLPNGFQAGLASEDLDAALAHEFAHLRRRDFAKNLFYEALSLPAAFHPLLWFTHSRIAESRELLCDSMAAGVVAGPQRYARSLLRLASRFAEQTLAPTTHAIGIFDANHFKNFERRVMHLTNNPMELKGARRLATAAICLCLLCGACTSALAFRMQIAAPEPQPTPQATPQPTLQASPQPTPQPAPAVIAVPRAAAGEPAQSFVVDIPASTIAATSTAPIKVITSPYTEAAVRIDNVNVHTVVDANVHAAVSNNVHATVNANIQAAQDSPARVSGGVMAGNRLAGTQPVYPPDAKAAGIEGSVILHAVIGKDGTMKELSVVSGPKELQDSALNAVKQWTYKPYLLNGDPVAVETTITVNFSLQK